MANLNKFDWFLALLAASGIDGEILFALCGPKSGGGKKIATESPPGRPNADFNKLFGDYNYLYKLSYSL